MESNGREVVLITGCSTGGIGNALARAFATKGCQVVATSRSVASMVDLAGDNRFFLLDLDVRSSESVEHALSAVMEKFGRVDILVNNAGVQCIAPVSEVPLAAVDATFDTNFLGPMRLIQAVVPHMASRRKGKIVNVGSVTALAPGLWMGVYAASKSALHSLSDSLRLELKPLGIHVITVAPGGIKSNIGPSGLTSYKEMPEWKLYKPNEEAMKRLASLENLNKKFTPSEVLAKKTVALILKKNPPPWFHYGKFSTVMVVMYHLPICIRDFLYKIGEKSML